MHKLYGWYYGLSPWYRAALVSLFSGVVVGSYAGAAMGRPGIAIVGFVFGLIFGSYLFYRERNDTLRISEASDEANDDYPEDLDRVERRYKMQTLTLPVALAVPAIGVSWIVFGTGLYGGLVALLATIVSRWALARFGGPDDPKWSAARDEWRRQHMERNRAS